MTLDELVALIHLADRKRSGGVLVEITAVTHPTAGAQMYGKLTVGHREYQRIFRTAEELRSTLEALTK